MSIAFSDDLARRLSAHGLAPEASKWVLKALHPASAHECDGIPDASYVKSVRVEVRGQITVGAPAGTTGTWCLVVRRSALDVNPIVTYSAPEPVIAWNVGSLTIGDFAAPVAVQPFLYNSNEPISAGANIYDTDDFRSNWRTMYSSLTCYMTASALNDSGTVYAGQTAGVPAVEELAQFFDDGSLVAPYVTLSYGATPVNPDDMARGNPRYYTAPARDGVYMPFRFFGPIAPMRARETRVGMQASQGSNDGPIYLSTVVAGNPLTSGNPASQRMLVNAALPVDTNGTGFLGVNTFVDGSNGVSKDTCSCFYDNSAEGVVFFTGLSPAATITIKYIVGHEMVVLPTSPVAPFAKIPLPYDPRALEAYYRIVHELPDAYPSSWNSIGILGSALSALASRLWPAVKAAVPHLVTAGKSAFKAAMNPEPMSSSQRVVVTAGARRPSGMAASTPRAKPKRKKRSR
jgi:hypothetical protein